MVTSRLHDRSSLTWGVSTGHFLRERFSVAVADLGSESITRRVTALVRPPRRQGRPFSQELLGEELRQIGRQPVDAAGSSGCVVRV
jgi:hypothetical protein